MSSVKITVESGTNWYLQKSIEINEFPLVFFILSDRAENQVFSYTVVCMLVEFAPNLNTTYELKLKATLTLQNALRRQGLVFFPLGNNFRQPYSPLTKL